MKLNVKILKIFSFLLINLAIFTKLNVFACSISAGLDIATSQLVASCVFLDNTLGPATNCAVQNKTYSSVITSGKTLYCSSESKVVSCPTITSTLNYDSVFQKALNNRTGQWEYINLRPGTGCDYLVPRTVAPSNQCQNKSTDPDTPSCTFGNLITGSGTQNCAENSTEGVYDKNGKKIYCAPNNQKVFCDSAVDYKDLFEPVQTYDNTRGTYIYDYTGKLLSNRAIRDHNCQVGLPSLSIVSGCNVTAASLDNDSCVVPQDCYANSAQPVPVSRVGMDRGALYCISKPGKPREGLVYFCPNLVINWPSITRPYRYDEITDKVDAGNGDFSINLKSRTPVTCIPTLLARTTNRTLNPLSPINLIKTISTTLYYFAIFYFIVLILINAFAYVRSGEDPSKLKQIKESLFNTIAGFIFVIASGGVIVYLINQLS